MGRRVRQENGAKDPFGTYLPHAAHPSCRPSLRGLAGFGQTTVNQETE